MIGTQDTYYQRAEVSNSVLGELQKYFLHGDQLTDILAAYRFGNLIDAMITEPSRCDHYSYRVDDEQFTAEEWGVARKMHKAFLAHPFCANVLQHSTGQMVMSRDMDFQWGGLKFTLPVRCKWDLWMAAHGWGCDIKSTTAISQKQFEAALGYFDYDRQRAFYMDISGAPQDMLIGISKINFQIFMVPIRRGDKLHTSGVEKYNAAAGRYFTLFSNFF